MLFLTAPRVFVCGCAWLRTRVHVQCLDDSLTNVVPKDQLTSYKLGGAPECHAPELAQELKAAKAEVRCCVVYRWLALIVMQLYGRLSVHILLWIVLCCTPCWVHTLIASKVAPCPCLDCVLTQTPPHVLLPDARLLT